MSNSLKPLTEALLALLEKRGISGEMAARLGWQALENRSGAWIAIPYFRMGKTVNHKFRTIDDRKEFSQEKGGEQCFYNLEAIEKISTLSAENQRSSEVVITEGEMDCAIALQCGYLAISVPNGAPDKKIESEESTKFDYLSDFPRWAVAVLATDEDSAGRVLRQELALRLGWHRCKWIQYPKGCKDLNEVFIKYGKKGVDKVLREKTKFMNQGGLHLLSGLPAQPELPTYACNIGNASEMIKLRPGDTIVVTGIPSMGKSLFVNCLTCNMVRDYGWKACIGSFESNPRGDLLRYLRTYYLDKAPKDSTGNYQWTDMDVAEADAWIERHFSFICPDLESDDLITLKWVLTRIKAAVMQYGARIVVIDPWNELDHDRPNGMTLTEYTGYAIKEFKRVAKQFMISVVIVAHPAKMDKDKDGQYNVPSLYDISDSSHWYNKCDLGIVIHRYESEREDEYATLIRVAKVRDWGVIGKIGDRMMEYLPDRGKYIDVMNFQPKKRNKQTDPKKSKEEKLSKPLAYKDDDNSGIPERALEHAA